MLLPNRHGNSSDYRYAFNGKEKDDEVKGEGAQYDYGFRIYDPRIGKFLSTDPLFKGFPYYTPYQFAGNTPIQAIDLDGLEEYHYAFTLDENGDSEIKLETVNDIIEKQWNRSTFSYTTKINVYEKHIVHYRPEILVVVEFQGIMAKQD
ncbi:RHS repeat-associated core domain-containing protein [Algibacter sp. 2305UL17-15]|uniref:RHS repeat domain-containing protein n=1 Tax=Algibacter sp. 2305UL17-15 TaxID=3231268 RepID=UPI0034586DB3